MNIPEFGIFHTFSTRLTIIISLTCYFQSIVGEVSWLFDGSESSVIDLSDSFNCVQGNNPRSVHFQVQTRSTAPSMLVYTGDSNDMGLQTAFRVEINYGSGSGTTPNIIQFDVSSSAFMPTSGTKINDGLWHDVWVTYDGTTAKIYVDNQLDNSATSWNSATPGNMASTVNTNGHLILLGGEKNGNVLIGNMRDVQFYNCVVFPPTSPPSIYPTTNSPTNNPSVTSVVPSTTPVEKPLPSCSDGWTLHCACQWTSLDEAEVSVAGSSPAAVAATPNVQASVSPYQFSLTSAAAGLVVGIMIVIAVNACTRSTVKDLDRSEYFPIVEQRI